MSSRLDCIANSEVSNNDVLLGRGALLDRFEGNVQFRTLVRAYWPTYRSSVTTYAQRQQVVRSVLDTVQAKGGRFLRRVPTTTTHDDGQSDDNDPPPWEEVDKAVATEKVKQSFRDLNQMAAKSHRKSTVKVQVAPSSAAERIIPSPVTVSAQSQATESSSAAVSSLVATATVARQTRPAASMIGSAPDKSIPID